MIVKLYNAYRLYVKIKAINDFLRFTTLEDELNKFAQFPKLMDKVGIVTNKSNEELMLVPFTSGYTNCVCFLDSFGEAIENFNQSNILKETTKQKAHDGDLYQWCITKNQQHGKLTSLVSTISIACIDFDEVLQIYRQNKNNDAAAYRLVVKKLVTLKSLVIALTKLTLDIEVGEEVSNG